MFIRKILVAAMLLIAQSSIAQQVKINILDSGRKVSLRGLSVVDDNILWASGSNGTVARSVDGGKSIEWLTIAGYEKRDFRDIEAIDANTAIIMAIADPAVILKTRNGGKGWYQVFEDTAKGMFLDAMSFSNDKNGTVIGDPIAGHMFIASTTDSGETWFKNPVQPALAEGEAMFASSGTNIKWLDKTSYPAAVVTGGTKSNFILLPVSPHLPVISTPLAIIQGKESTGANSIAVYKKNIYIVGGDFTNDKDTTANSVFSKNNGEKWLKPGTPPHGYRSCVEYITKNKLVTCGTSGTDISTDGGRHWQLVSQQGFHVCRKAKKGNRVFLAGGNGKIAVLETTTGF